MNQQREVRHAAAQAFNESLKQLQQRLEVADEPKKSPMKNTRNQSFPQSSSADATFDLGSFEDAIADIDQFIQSREGNSHSS